MSNRSPRFLHRAIGGFSLACALAAFALAPALTSAETTGRIALTVQDATLDEISGLAVSARHRNAFWVLEDSGKAAALTAIGKRGERIATYTIEGETNVDWEDLSSFLVDGKPHLLIADVGDNEAVRERVRLIAVAEPSSLRDGALRPVWSIEFVWPGGARDCEAIAVDSRRGEILLISKRHRPPELFVLSLNAEEGATRTPRRLAALAGIRVLDDAAVRANPKAIYRHQVTGASLTPDGRRLAVLTYSNILVYERRRNEGWAEAIARKPRTLALPPLRQAEAIAWTRNAQALLVTSEDAPAPVYRVAVPAPK
ncbi:MAG: hypothetical protein KA144_07470 [Xanthomonadaceae bacterium]|nr:hypothetical protein [Xanthomonadaceae bacterium]